MEVEQGAEVGPERELVSEAGNEQRDQGEQPGQGRARDRACGGEGDPPRPHLARVDELEPKARPPAERGKRQRVRELGECDGRDAPGEEREPPDLVPDGPDLAAHEEARERHRPDDGHGRDRRQPGGGEQTPAEATVDGIDAVTGERRLANRRRGTGEQPALAELGEQLLQP